MAIPDYCEPIIGWRFWRVGGQSSDRLRLVSGNAYTTGGGKIPWPPYQRFEAQHYDYLNGLSLADMSAEMLAAHLARQTCREPPCRLHAPIMVPGCGIYAMTTSHSLQHEMVARVPQNLGTYLVVGRVALWGRVAVHTEGYRAQYAYPQALVGGSPQVDVARLAATYGIPYEEEESWKSVLNNDASWPSPFEYLSPNVPSTWAKIRLSPPLSPSLNLFPRKLIGIKLAWSEEDKA